jgi:molybdopterin/thiamine biosynthesis adenylyltransferase
MSLLEIRGARVLAENIEWLTSSQREELLALFGRSVTIPRGHLIVVTTAERAPEEHVRRTKAGLRWSPELTRRWSARVESSDESVVLLHAHHHVGPVELSPTDQGTSARILDHFSLVAPNQCHAYGVVGYDSVAGAFRLDGTGGDIAALTTVSGPIHRREAGRAQEGDVPMSLDRQVRALGESAQRRLARARVALLGLGGGGSIAAEQLGHMGVQHLVFVDGDVLKEVNLSRQACSGPADVGRPKAEVIADALHRDCGIEPMTIVETFPGVGSYQELKDVDVIVSAVDGAHARNELNRFARRYCIPVVDIGATIRTRKGQLTAVAGHVVRAMPDGACLECEGLTSPTLREAERGQHRVPYRDGAEDEGAPQVMSINGVLASAASTEVLKLLTGFAATAGTVHWRYDGLSGELYPREPVRAGCDACALTGLADASA